MGVVSSVICCGEGTWRYNDGAAGWRAEAFAGLTWAEDAEDGDVASGFVPAGVGFDDVDDPMSAGHARLPGALLADRVEARKESNTFDH